MAGNGSIFNIQTKSPTLFKACLVNYLRRNGWHMVTVNKNTYVCKVNKASPVQIHDLPHVAEGMAS